MTLYCVYIIACSEHGLYWWNKFGYPFGIINFLMNWCAKAHLQWRVVRTSPIGMNFIAAYITEFFCSGVTDTEKLYWNAEGLRRHTRTSLTFHYKHSVRFRDDDHEIRYRQKSESPLGSGPKWLEDEVPPGFHQTSSYLKEIVKAWLLRWSKHQGIQRTRRRFF